MEKKFKQCFIFLSYLFFFFAQGVYAAPEPSSRTVPIVMDALDHINYSSPISGFIEHIFKEGATFNKGDILAQYNCTVMRSEESKAKASVNYLHEKKRNMERLFRLGGASHNEQSEVTNQLKTAEEELIIKSYIVSQCTIKAPFDGQVVKVFGSPFEYIEQGKPLLEIVNLNNVEVKLILPSEWMSSIKKGTQFKVTLNETKQSYTAEIVRVVYSIDAVSNTFVAFAQILNEPSELKPGMSGIADFGKAP